MDEAKITVVSGLPRSGTSMMMEMLEKGGLEVLTDEVRKPDEDNPKGYYEYEKVKRLPEDTKWLQKAEGKAVKVLGELIKHLPEDHEYKIVFMERNLKEIIESQAKMLKRKGKDSEDISKEDLRETFENYRKILKKQISSNPSMEVIYVNYNDIMSHPEPVIESISAFFSEDLDKDAMLSVIDDQLYRNRAELEK